MRWLRYSEDPDAPEAKQSTPILDVLIPVTIVLGFFFGVTALPAVLLDPDMGLGRAADVLILALCVGTPASLVVLRRRRRRLPPPA